MSKGHRNMMKKTGPYTKKNFNVLFLCKKSNLKNRVVCPP